MLRLLIGIAAAALLLLSSFATSRLRRSPVEGTLPIDPLTPFVRYAHVGARRGGALVVHGLDANKEFMNLFSLALADSGYDVVAIDLPGHGDSRIAFNATLARKAVANALAYLRSQSGAGDFAAVGHSFGAGLLLDVAGDVQIPTLVLLSPPPEPLLAIQANRTLIVSGDYDIPAINAFIPELTDLAQPNVEWRRLKWTSHSGAVFNYGHIESTVEWIAGDNSHGPVTQAAGRMRMLIVQSVSAVVLFLILFPGKRTPASPKPLAPTLVRYVAAFAAAPLILRTISPFSWLKLFDTDYLVAFLFIGGAALSIGVIAFRETSLPPLRPAIHAIAAAAYVVSIGGLLIGSNFMHMNLFDGRFWRFPVIAAAGFPLFFADETLLRPIGGLWKSAAAAFLTRLVMAAALVTGVLILSRRAAFLTLMSHLLALFWTLLWFATAIVRRNVQSPVAAALFSALVQAWLFAALFVAV